MKAIFINTKDQTVEYKEITNSFDALSKLLETDEMDFSEQKQNEKEEYLYVDVLSDSPAYFILPGFSDSPIAGNAAILGKDENGEPCDTTLTIEEIQFEIDFYNIGKMADFRKIMQYKK